MARVEDIGDLMGIRLVRDANGTFIGLYGTPCYGGTEWHADNGGMGNCDSEEAAVAVIEAIWHRDRPNQ